MRTWTEFGPVLVLFDFWLSFSGLGRVSPSAMSAAKDDGTNSQDDATDEIMDRLVKSVTQNPSERPSSPKTRKRSRLNRKSSEYQQEDIYYSVKFCSVEVSEPGSGSVC